MTKQTYTDKQRAEALRIFEENGAIAAAKTIGCSRMQVYRWYKESVTLHIEKSEEEQRVDIAYQHAIRLRARRRMLSRIDNLFDRMDQPHIDFKGKDVEQITYPTASSTDIRNYVTSIAILIDKYRLEMGEATGRIETVTPVDAELERIAREFARDATG